MSFNFMLAQLKGVEPLAMTLQFQSCWFFYAPHELTFSALANLAPEAASLLLAPSVKKLPLN